MFKQMRRAERETEKEEALQILQRAQYGTLATHGEDGYPYAVPLNHVISGGKICFHCAHDGVKIENIKRNPRVCFSAAAAARTLPEAFATAYESAVAFGTAQEAKGARKIEVLTALIEKFAPAFAEKGVAHIAGAAEKTAVYEIEIEHITGKKSKNPEEREHKK